ncbi:MAG: sortase B protein-sorting domain-containing protein [Massiliimalia sp.]|jgi:hypothetical protein
MNGFIKKKDWLIPVMLILFLLAVVLLPFAAERTYAGRNENPNHVLTYTTGSLTWDSATHVDEKTGVAELSLFNSTYQNVQAENGDKVVAPGTEGKNIVRLKNNAGNTIEYIAVMYRIKDEDTLPVEPVLEDDTAFTDTQTYPLPEGVTKDQVVRAVKGTVRAKELQDFDITWLWKYYESDERDQIDTALGNKAAWDIADEVQAGLYIVVVEDSGGGEPGGPDPQKPETPDTPDNPDPENPNPNVPNTADPDDPYTYPQIPQTGDSSNLMLYLILTIISGVLLLLMIVDRRKEKRCKKS